MRLIDADELKAVYIPSEIEGFEKMMVPVEVVLQNIDDMPTVDAVEVVRCKDCKSFSHGYCRFHDAKFVRPDGYCYWGERKDGDNGL